jgi:hypothetical protein
VIITDTNHDFGYHCAALAVQELNKSVEILYEVLDVYILRCILVWPKAVKKEDIIKKLYSIVISKISDIQFRMSEMLSSFKAGNFYLVTQLSVYQRIYGTANF